MKFILKNLIGEKNDYLKKGKFNKMRDKKKLFLIDIQCAMALHLFVTIH